MTPMIDVLLVLIIIFMVITPIATRGLEASVPREPESASPVDDSALVVEIDSTGRLRLNQRDLEHAELGERLRLVVPRPVFVKGDGELEYQAVAQVIDIARGAGVGQIGLLSGTKSEASHSR
jgi:biopolymer transport protein ExbD